MKNTENLQRILMGIFLVIFLVSVAVFAGYIPIGKTNQKQANSMLSGEIEIWGVLSPNVVNPALRLLEEKNENKLKIVYLQKGMFDLEKDYTEALAKNSGPDLVLFTNFQLLTLGDKFFQIPYQSFPKSQFQLEYIDSASVFLGPYGIIGLPFAQDPMVLFYNKDILASNFEFEPPKFWEDYNSFASKYTVRDGANLSRSALALGTFSNITYATEILSLMFLQSRNPISVASGESYKSTLEQNFIKSNISVSAYILDFFNSFSDPNLAQYSWNRVKNNDKSEFLAGRLATYFGFASDSASFIQSNPNLNVGVSVVPQWKDTPPATISRLYAFGINPKTENLQLSLSVMWELSGRTLGTFIGGSFGMQSIFKNQIKVNPEDDVDSVVFSQSSFISKSWPDPNPQSTFIIFREMVEDSTSGILDSKQAIQRASRELNKSYEETIK